MRHFFRNRMVTEQLFNLFRDSRGVSTDSRNIRKGQIYFALWGENHNGNKFAAEALGKGASWAVIDDPVYETEKTILVDDCLFELQALATRYRKELKAQVLAITGTNGKTTTKELISSVLAKKYKVHSTQGNLNNHIGVPLTILSAPSDTQIIVIEMGANHVGEIRTLCLIARPDYGIITNVSNAHIEGFGSFEGVVRAKTELYEYLRKVNGIALYNDKDPVLTEKIYKLVNRAVPFSDPTGIDLVVEPVQSDINLIVDVTYLHQKYSINTNLFGAYNINNVKAAIATGLFMDVNMNDVANAISAYKPVNSRSQVKITVNNTLICDYYNANPASMKLAIESLSNLKAEKKVCILADMLELGDKSEEEHLKVIDVLKQNKIESALLTGPVFSKVGIKSGYKTFDNLKNLIDYLKTNPVKGGHILIKGSRGMTLEKIIDLL